jgi:hypothetical protein
MQFTAFRGAATTAMISQEQHLLGFAALLFAFMPRSKSPNLGSTSNRGIEASHRRTESFYLKLLLGGLIGVILLIAVFWGGHSAYARWQERRLIRKAVFAIEHGDEHTASLAARNVLELRPSSASAARIMAQLTEKAGDRIALDWRRNVVQLEPQSTDDALAWGRCALQFNDIATAERALAKVHEKGQATAAYHAVCALLAEARQEEQKADSEWTQAVRLTPNEKTYQLRLGILRAHARDADRHASGEMMLRALRDDPKQRAAATRALITEGVAHRENMQELLALARELQAYPEAIFSDRLLFLDFLHQSQDAQFTGYLTQLEKNATASALDLAALLLWMSRNNLDLLALDFVRGLPPDLLEKWPAPIVLADIYARLKDWHGLEAFIKNANWRQFDFLRHAYLASALRAENKSAAAEHEWATATREASGQSDAVFSLIRAASEWRWDNETVDLLWTLAKFPEKQREALQTLYRFYAKSGDTLGLHRVLVRLAASDPSNLDVQNNVAQISLLLKANPEESRRLAADVYRKMPANAAYAATYAYSLLSKGDVEGAVKIMGSLTEEQLRDPAISAYYGICLAATSDERASAYLEIGQKATLLPEEKALIEKALRDLDSRRRPQ